MNQTAANHADSSRRGATIAHGLPKNSTRGLPSWGPAHQKVHERAATDASAVRTPLRESGGLRGVGGPWSGGGREKKMPVHGAGTDWYGEGDEGRKKRVWALVRKQQPIRNRVLPFPSSS